jgi:VIT1/CCC1 family predicted Fe2+/Mn2+ transporter
MYQYLTVIHDPPVSLDGRTLRVGRRAEYSEWCVGGNTYFAILLSVTRSCPPPVRLIEVKDLPSRIGEDAAGTTIGLPSCQGKRCRDARRIEIDRRQLVGNVNRADLARPRSGLLSLVPKRPAERHHAHKSGWLRAAVLGANDGILSTASLLLGVAAAHGSHGSLLVAGVAGLVSGSMAMAAGEYVSVHSQADTEQADLRRERAELKADEKAEHRELAAIYVGRGLDPLLAKEVARQLMAHDAIGAHARDELGISETLKARPVQAAFVSAGSFAAGAAIPVLVTALAPSDSLIAALIGSSLLSLLLLGALAARAGGAAMIPAAIRVTFWGALAMGVTAGVGVLIGTAL